jgi:hypothetical protein
VTLNKPANEECGNCHFCVSHLMKITEKDGLFKTTERIIEAFNCHRSPPRAEFYGVGTDVVRIDQSVCVVCISKDHWCGEWKARKL